LALLSCSTPGPGGSFIFHVQSFFLSLKLEQGTVTSLVEENGAVRGVQYKSKDGQQHEAYAPLTIVCDGCFSNLRRSLCNPQVKLSFETSI
jgi:2-polyprenyl-6-methoxyphenol hydroxylase-like FAD-dependent oxidoreductase